MHFVPIPQLACGGTLKKLVLDQMITPARRLYSTADAVRWGIQMAVGLAHLHSINPMVRQGRAGGWGWCEKGFL